MNRKEIFLLIGQKGSGKSFVGKIIEKEFGIKFIRVESWIKNIKKGRDVYDEKYIKHSLEMIENGIRQEINKTDKLVFESTGITKYFDRMLESLKEDFRVTTIGIHADSKICLNRVKTRDKTIHINISDNQVITINAKVREKDFTSDFHIDNGAKTNEDLIKELKDILTRYK
ncbi:MAG: hypothetical protein ABFS16_10155 [Bacteroidota bacterium]